MDPHRIETVTLAQIAEQRATGWSDFHPEDFCHRCGGKNLPSWHTSSEAWRAAFGADDGLITCPQCFVAAYETAEGDEVWELRPTLRPPMTSVVADFVHQSDVAATLAMHWECVAEDADEGSGT